MAAAKPSIVIAALGLATLVLAGCTDQASPQATEQQATEPLPPQTTAAGPVPEAVPTPEATDTGTCSELSEVFSPGSGLYWERQGTLRDLGAREFAQGEVAVDAHGTPVTYTVAPGDVETVVAERLCAYPNLASMNHRRDIHPGQVLWLTPDPEIPWVPYHGPLDAPAGFQQIPYEQAIEAAGAAVDAGDVDSVRRIWEETLKGMFRDQTTIDAVQAVVDAGDLDALRQVFS